MAAADDAVELIVELLDREGVSRAELARRLGVSSASVTQGLRSSANPTIDRLARAARALGYELHLTATKGTDHG